MTPAQALDEMIEQDRQRGEMYIRYAPDLLLELLRKSMKKALHENDLIGYVTISEAGSVTINQSWSRMS